MEAIMKLCVDCALKEKLDAISEPKNTILARIQKYFMFNENDNEEIKETIWLFEGAQK